MFLEILGFFLSLGMLALPFYLISQYFKHEDKKKRERSRWSRTYHGRKERKHRTESRIFSYEERSKILTITDGLCFHCLTNVKSENFGYWEIDHLWPKKLGGVDNSWNLVASCQNCNTKKGYRNPFYLLVDKWKEQGELNRFEMKFLNYYANKSPSHLTNNPNWDKFMNEASQNIREFLFCIQESSKKLTEVEKNKIADKFKAKFADWSVI